MVKAFTYSYRKVRKKEKGEILDRRIRADAGFSVYATERDLYHRYRGDVRSVTLAFTDLIALGLVVLASVVLYLCLYLILK